MLPHYVEKRSFWVEEHEQRNTRVQMTQRVVRLQKSTTETDR